MTETEKKAYAESMERKRLALSVSTIRKSRGMSRNELAEKAGYKSASAISSIENGSDSPSYEKVKDIANALEVSIAQLKLRGKIETDESGWPKFNESERIALYLFAPILKSLDEEDIRALLHTAVRFCEKDPAWKQTDYQKKDDRR